MKAGIIFNLKKKARGNLPKDFYAEFDDISVPEGIKASIEKLGFEVDLLEFDLDLFSKLKSSNYDFIFNIAEGLFGESRESHVPAILEFLQIPYTASGVLTQAITLDKGRTKEILLQYGLPTPKFKVIKSASDELGNELKYPLMIKPNLEGSSKGITSKSLVKTPSEAKELIVHLLKEYNQPVLVEEFLPGREFTVALMGNEEVYALPAIEILVNNYSDNAGIYHFENKFVNDEANLHVKAILDEPLKKEIYGIAKGAYKALGCKDLSRIDIRLDPNGKPSIIEMNCLPGVNPDPNYGSYFTLSCLWAGISYDEMISAVVYLALKRYRKEGLIGEKGRLALNRIKEVDLVK